MSTNTTEADLNTALQIAGMISGTLPAPFGTIASITLNTLDEFLPYFFGGGDGSGPPPVTLAQIGQLIAAQEVDDTITSALAVFNALLQTYQSDTTNVSMPFPSSMDPAILDDPDNSFSNLYNLLHASVTGSSSDSGFDLLTQISKLTSGTSGDICQTGSNLQAAFINAFSVGVSLYITLWEFIIAMYYAVQKSLPATFIGEIQGAINQLSSTPVYSQPGWIGYATNVMASFNGAVTTRTGLVSAGIPITFGGWLWDTEYAVYFIDKGEQVANFSPATLPLNYNGLPPWPGSTGETEPVVESMPPYAVYAAASTQDNQALINEDVNGLSQSYVTAMQQQIYVNYFDPSQLQSVLQAWDNGVTNLKNAIANAQSQ
ncbi:MAG TPA: hypothetical protein VFJ82_03320 [Longimicrobium sp.]|nr:hypothetical protein [Longimicrobium sp.]